MIGLSVLELVLEYIPTYCLVGVLKLGKYSWRLANSKWGRGDKRARHKSRKPKCRADIQTRT